MPANNIDPKPKYLSRIYKYLDWFVISLLVIMVLGILIPLPDEVVRTASFMGHYAVVLLFLVYGARLPSGEVFAGLRNWKLQLTVLVATFVFFPLLGWVNNLLFEALLGTGFALGMIYTTILPSTVQSSISFTSIAGGNVAGAVTAATISNLVGMLATPMLVIIMMGRDGSINMQTIWDVLLLILLPFVIGQLLQPLLGSWLREHPILTKIVDRGTIYLVVISAVCGATSRGLWQGVEAQTYVILSLDCFLVLGVMLTATWAAGSAWKMNLADKIALLMCGSKKSLATGLPMAVIIFPPEMVGKIAVPVMIFHLQQLIICSIIAQSMSRTKGKESAQF